ncbi:hypothetical protein [Nostoc piscinale]|uniref:hypothetical protein n=1 Tax=Nostoc piscinale TaxID=224012 RepID=UPI000B284768|nr:hypothetical protein [Nostoc piscinale]
MSEQDTINKPSTNGKTSHIAPRKGKQRQWKDLTVDPLSEGFDSHIAEYVVGKAPVTWVTLEAGQLFSRTKSGKNLYVKLNDGRAVSLDTRQPIEFKPSIRQTTQVCW